MGLSCQWAVPPRRLSDTVKSSRGGLCELFLELSWPFIHLIAAQRAGSLRKSKIARAESGAGEGPGQGADQQRGKLEEGSPARGPRGRRQPPVPFLPLLLPYSLPAQQLSQNGSLKLRRKVIVAENNQLPGRGNVNRQGGCSLAQ